MNRTTGMGGWGSQILPSSFNTSTLQSTIERFMNHSVRSVSFHRVKQYQESRIMKPLNLSTLLSTVLLLSQWQAKMQVMAFSTHHSFPQPNTIGSKPLRTSMHRYPLLLTAVGEKEGDDLTELRQDIETLRQEALERLQSLDDQLVIDDDDEADGTIAAAPTVAVERDFTESIAISNDPSIVSSTRPDEEDRGVKSATRRGKKDELLLLEGTEWKLSLNIGREQGRYMLQTIFYFK